ncbi:Hypothetical protein A7982_01083 [Minicystis rosea]|nr:Hypothetical protein A7982_01083 [Minicystis rosea]
MASVFRACSKGARTCSSHRLIIGRVRFMRASSRRYAEEVIDKAACSGASVTS